MKESLNAKKVNQVCKKLETLVARNKERVLNLIHENGEIRGWDVECITADGDFIQQSVAADSLIRLYRDGWLKVRIVKHKGCNDSKYYSIDYDKIEKVNKALKHLSWVREQ